MLTPAYRLSLCAALISLLIPPSLADTPAGLELKASCSMTTGSGASKLIYSDELRLKIQQQQVQELNWESLRLRATLGHECSIDLDDGVQVEALADGWRLSLKESAQARSKRGYDTDRGNRCSIRVRQNGEEWHIQPTCPVLCGSRLNFSELYINPKNGQCRYEENQQD